METNYAAIQRAGARTSLDLEISQEARMSVSLFGVHLSYDVLEGTKLVVLVPWQNENTDELDLNTKTVYRILKELINDSRKQQM